MLYIIRSHWYSSTYRLSNSTARVEFLEGLNRVAPGRVQEVKQGVSSGGKLQNGGGARGQWYRPPVRQC